MAVTLIRHTTPDVVAGTCYGRTDLDLSDSFETEARDVLANLPEGAGLVTSPLRRCRRLAAQIAAARGVVPVIIEDWQEMDFGAWEGVAWDAIGRDALDGWAEDFHHYDGHGGESVAMFEARIRRALQATPRGALVVTHAGCIKAALAIAGQGAGWEARTPFGGIVTVTPDQNVN